MKSISKALIGTVAAGAMAISAASPAAAQYRGRDRGGVDVGDIIAGALIIGGIAAVAGSAGRNNDRGYGYGYEYGNDGYRYDRAGYGYDNPRQAVEQCVSTAERGASRYSYGRADVTDIRDVKRTRYGYEVKGRIAVNGQNRGWREGDNRYGRGWGGDYRGYNDNLRGYDSGSFKCKVERGRVVDLDYSGIRGL